MMRAGVLGLGFEEQGGKGARYSDGQRCCGLLKVDCRVDFEVIGRPRARAALTTLLYICHLGRKGVEKTT